MHADILFMHATVSTSIVNYVEIYTYACWTHTTGTNVNGLTSTEINYSKFNQLINNIN